MPLRILLVEDEPELRQALGVRLTAAGFVCEMAGDGKEGLAKSQQWQPDLIVADLVMPEMDGYEMMRRLKADARTASIPVVVLTAVPSRSLEPRLAELNAARVLHKPFDSDDLLVTVRGILTPTAEGGTHHG